MKDSEYSGSTMEKLRRKSAEKGPVALLVVSCPERKARLAAILSGLGVESLWVRRCREALELLRTQPPLQIVLTDTTLEDANWCDLLRAVGNHDSQASVVVVAPPSADEVLWSEVMWRGAYDMLVEPFTRNEAQRILEGALRAAGDTERAIVV
jgi:DNA-binding NtrC family response regulator